MTSAASPAVVPDWRGLKLVGESAAMSRLRQLVERCARRDDPVLILGETGTGKENVARAVHQLSKRGSAPCVLLNCGAIPAELFEGELFGHAKGAFTGALTDRPGQIEEADGGTLILDEIAAMSQKHQVKLLRVLQEKKLRRVGDSKERSVDFRIVAATNEMKRALADGRFRPDLYMRLDVLRIEVPPLRERASDIALLAEQSLGDSGREFARDALDLMERFAWPGNVRQLENVVTRVLAYCDSNPIPASEVEPLLRDSLIYFSDDPKGMACRCRDAVAQLVADELAKGNDPSQGLRQGSAQLGQLAQTVAEGIVEGLRLYLATDEGVRQHGAASNEDLMVLIGASGRSGNPSLLMRELVQRVRTIVDEMTAQRSAD